MRTILACLLLTACVADPADDTSDGGKAEDLSPGKVPTLAAAYALRLDAHFDLCIRDLNDIDQDGVRDECTAKLPTTDELSVVGLWQPRQTGATASGALTLCAAASIAGGHALTIDSGFLRKVPAVQLKVTLVSLAGKPALVGAPVAIVLGARLADPLRDVLPALGTDPRVFDQDSDGRPGFSIGAPIGSVFAALRVILRVEGPIDSAGAFAGDAEVDVDQVIYGDSIPFVDAVADAAASALAALLVGEDHGFVLAPIAAATCSAAVTALP